MDAAAARPARPSRDATSVPGAAGPGARVAPPRPAFPGEDVVADTGRVNAAIEAMVREAPAQYLWIHRRFKRQPEGAPVRYPRRARRP